MIKHTSLVAIAALFAAWASAADAEDNLKVGIIATLSGPPAVLGQQLRNGFQLAVKDLGGKLGGREAEIFVADDELKPDVAVTKVKSLIDRDKVEFVVGPIFSNILGAIAKPVTEAGVILISPNAGTSTFAGKECNPNLFVTSYQNDQVHEVLANTPRIPAIRKSSSSCRTIRPARMPPPASSTNSAARSPTKSTCRSASPTIRPS
jgi:branched-chain amino acid transport system substrate-binding protein